MALRSLPTEEREKKILHTNFKFPCFFLENFALSCLRGQKEVLKRIFMHSDVDVFPTEVRRKCVLLWLTLERAKRRNVRTRQQRRQGIGCFITIQHNNDQHSIHRTNKDLLRIRCPAFLGHIHFLTSRGRHSGPGGPGHAEERSWR